MKILGGECGLILEPTGAYERLEVKVTRDCVQIGSDRLSPSQWRNINGQVEEALEVLRWTGKPGMKS